MGRKPDKAPDWRKRLSADIRAPGEETAALMRKANQHYYYWDKFRVQPFPPGVDREAAWAYLKFQREAQLKELELGIHPPEFQRLSLHLRHLPRHL
jgi:hypothetical protein